MCCGHVLDGRHCLLLFVLTTEASIDDYFCIVANFGFMLALARLFSLLYLQYLEHTLQFLQLLLMMQWSLKVKLLALNSDYFLSFCFVLLIFNEIRGSRDVGKWSAMKHETVNKRNARTFSSSVHFFTNFFHCVVQIFILLPWL